MRGKIMNYIYDYISEERKKEIAYMNIVDTYNRTGYLDIPGDKVVKSKDVYFGIIHRIHFVSGSR